MEYLEIQLLGDFQLRVNGRSLAALSDREQALLVYLLLNRAAPQPRRHIAFQFWPDTSEKQAQTNLRNLYYRLRRKLPEADAFLKSDTQSLQWEPEGTFVLDVAAFATAVATATTVDQWQTAVDQYSGTLLPGWYQEWLEPERDRLRQMFIRAIIVLIDQLEARRDYPEAIRYAQRLLRHDSLHEATYRQLMRLQALIGDKPGALQTYHSCATALARELGVEPDATTRELYEQLLQADSLPLPVAVAPITPLVGRQEPWQEAQQAWQTAVRGRTHCLIIQGEAGIGKTRLAEELLDWAGRQGMATARTRAYVDEGSLAPLAAWLRSPFLQSHLMALDDIWLTEIARLLPEILVQRLDLAAPGPLQEDWQRQRFFEALAQAVLVSGRPLLLLFDDIQWCDGETLHWLRFLLRQHPATRLLLVLTYRLGEATTDASLASFLWDLGRDRQLTEVDLSPLNVAETNTLASHVAGQALSPLMAKRLFQETEGNPLFVVEMARVGLAADDGWETAVLPNTIQAVISARLAQLSATARRLVEWMGVIGRSVSYEVLVRATEQDEETVVQGLDELWRRRLIQEQGNNSYDFSHDKIREVAYLSLSLPRRRLLHRRVGQALEMVHASNLDVVCRQIAYHYEQAGKLLEAVPQYRRAAKTAQKLYANQDAQEVLHHALLLIQPYASEHPAMMAELHELLGDVQHFMGQHDLARATFEAAVEHVSPDENVWQARILYKAAMTYIPQHHYQAAARVFATAVAALGQPPLESAPDWWRTWLQIHLEWYWAYYWLNEWQKVIELSDLIHLVINQYGTVNQRADFLGTLVGLYLRRDRFVISDKVVSYQREILKVKEELGDISGIAAAAFGAGMGLLWYGAWDEAVGLMQKALRLTDETGDLNLRSRCLTYLTLAYRVRDMVEMVQEYAVQSRNVATQANMPEYVGTAYANMAWLAWKEGDATDVAEYGYEALKQWDKVPEGHASCSFQWTALLPLMAVALQVSETADAIDFARILLEPAQQRLVVLEDGLETAVSAWERGQSEAAHSQLEKVILLAQETHYL